MLIVDCRSHTNDHPFLVELLQFSFDTPYLTYTYICSYIPTLIALSRFFLLHLHLFYTDAGEID